MTRPRSVPYEPFLVESLRGPAEAEAYRRVHEGGAAALRELAAAHLRAAGQDALAEQLETP